MKQPLSDIRVLDLTRLLPGPYGSLLLADLGIEVIKVEQPVKGDYLREISYARFSSLNRNKKSVTLDLKTAEGKDIFYKLVKTADVVMEGNRPEVVKRLGVDYDTLKEINPKIIYCAISGYGQISPYKFLPGHDINYMGVAGALALTNEPNGPPPLPIADFSSGMFAAFAILAALMIREKAGVGQYLDVSMTDGVLSWMGPYIAEFQATCKLEKRNDKWRPGYGIFKCSDDKYITLGVVEDWFWVNLCKVIGRPELADDPKFKTLGCRSKNITEVYPVIEKALYTKTAEEWIRIMNENDVPCGPVNSIDDLAADPHVIQRKLMMDGKDFFGSAFPVAFSQTPVRARLKTPSLGEHTEDILKELQYLDSDIEKLKANKII